MWKKAITIFLVQSFFSLTFASFVIAQAGEIDLDFENQSLSAHIERAPLKAVVEKIAKRKGIWIKGDQYLTDENYSVQFKNLSVEGALERILSSMNYCLILDQKNEVLGLILIDNGRKAAVVRKRVTRRPASRYRRR